MGAAVGDYDNDGDLDLFVTAFGPETLYRNNGDGTFTDVTAQAGVSDPLWSTSAAFVDYDRDGDLDLFVANYLDFTIAGNKVCSDAVGARDYCSPRAYRPVPDRLYRNDGNGRFTDATEAAGITRADGAGLGVAPATTTATAGSTSTWRTMRRRISSGSTGANGTFEDEGLLSGSAVNAAGNPEGSMGIASGDFDRDGDEDLFVTNIVGETFALYVNDGQRQLRGRRARRRAWRAPTAAFTGFGTDWFDYDNDGWLDLFVANGAVNMIEAQRGQPRPFRMKNQLFRNAGDGRFVETTAAGGPAFARAEIGRGAAFGDIDNDGDVDVVATNNNGPVRLLLNQAEQATGRRRAEPLAAAASRSGAGRGNRFAVRRARRASSGRGADDVAARAHGRKLPVGQRRARTFGLGASARIAAVVVQWPDGVRDRYTDVAADRVVTLRRRAVK